MEPFNFSTVGNELDGTLREFLKKSEAPHDLLALFAPGMEYQLNLSPLGEEGGPKANVRNPKELDDGTIKFFDFRLTYDLPKYIQAFGLNGIDRRAGVARWVGFDFDGPSHADNACTIEEIAEIEEKAKSIPWVTVRHSTRGDGLHLYVFLEPPIPVKNRAEHKQLSSAVLDQMSKAASYAFDRVDTCGGILWFWSTKLRIEGNVNGLSLKSQGTTYDASNLTWQGFAAPKRSKRRLRPPEIVTAGAAVVTEYDLLTDSSPWVERDDDHNRLIKYLEESGRYHKWYHDEGMLRTHTHHLKAAHTDLKLKGVFETNSPGTNLTVPNCFSGDTEVITRQGVRTLRELANIGHAELLVMTKNGMEWINSPIQSFGIQKTVPMWTGDGNYLRTTLGHQWLYANERGEPNLWSRKSTRELICNRTRLPMAPITLPNIDWEGYAHGVVFGDGNIQSERGKHAHSCVTLFGEKQALAPLMSNYGTMSIHNREQGPCPYIYNLPKEWKEFPVNPTPSYALGFIMGLVSTDGNIAKANLKIFNASEDNIKVMRKLAVHAGLRCSNRINCQIGTSSYVPGTPSYNFRINTYNLTPGHFIRADQKAEFIQRSRGKTTTPYLIGYQDIIEEEVFCAQVTGYYNFTLANGLVTGNCFAYCCPNGVWRVIRYFGQASEHFTWSKTAKGWPTCYFNREADIITIIKMNKGVLTNPEKQIYGFNCVKDVVNVAEQMGKPINVEPLWLHDNRRATMTVTSQNDIIVDVERTNKQEAPVDGWASDKKVHRRVIEPDQANQYRSDTPDCEEVIRSLRHSSGDNLGWALRREDGQWGYEPSENVSNILSLRGYKTKDIPGIKGMAIFHKWTLVQEPFQPEYPGNRQWNRHGARLRFEPKEEGPFEFPSWQRVLNHLGQGLDDSVESNEWCQEHGIKTGAEYLEHWIANMIRFPYKRLPYLFFYSYKQNNGKTTLHAALRRLMSDKAVVIANQALTSQQFNGELLGAILCVIEEDNISEVAKNRAYNRIKAWTTDETLSIRQMYLDAYTIRNATHWIQCANDLIACPLKEGDTRVTVIEVPELQFRIPRDTLLDAMEAEGPDFIGHLNTLVLSDSDRLGLPPLKTVAKEQAIQLNYTDVESFIDECVFPCAGNMLSLEELYTAYLEWHKLNMSKEPLGKHKVSAAIKASNISCGRLSVTNEMRFINVSLSASIRPGPPYRIDVHNGSGPVIYLDTERVSSRHWFEQLKRQGKGSNPYKG